MLVKHTMKVFDITLLHNPRIQLVLAILLAICGGFLTGGQQSFLDYLLGGGGLLVSFFLCLHATIENKKLTSIERILCLLFFFLIFILIINLVHQVTLGRTFHY